MREIINIQLGQCGNHIGSHFLQKIAQEHEISPDCKYQGNSDATRYGTSIFFNELPNNQFVSRTILADCEPGSIDTARSSPFAKLYNPDNFVVGMGSAGNYATGYYSKGQELIYSLIDAVRSQADGCEHLEGFQILHGLSGGTGSGLTCLLMQKIKEEFPNIIVQNFSVFPSLNSDTVVSPYNAVLSMPHLIDDSHMVHVVQNEALFEICNKKMKIQKPTFRDANDLVATAMANSTCGLRFHGQLNSSLRKQAVNLVPFPRLHFLMDSLTPLIPEIERIRKYCAKEAVIDMRDRFSFLCSFGPSKMERRLNVSLPFHNRYLTATVIFRGKVSSHEAEQSLKNLQSQRYRRLSSRCRPWIPDNVQNYLCDVAPLGKDLCGLLIGNNTGISFNLKDIDEKMTNLRRKKAFIHYFYAEGMEDLQLDEAEADMRDLISDYQHNDINEEQEEEEGYGSQDEY